MRSMAIKTKATQLTTPIEPVHIGQPPMPGLIVNDDDNDSDASSRGPNLITDVDDESIADIFCFSAFTDKNTGVVYNACIRKFPSMSLDGNISIFCDLSL